MIFAGRPVLPDDDATPLETSLTTLPHRDGPIRDAGELALVEAMRSGDEQAFRRFFRDYVPRLFRFVLPRVHAHEATAEEVCQMTMSRAMRFIHSYRGEAALFSWLCSIARNEIADAHARRKRDAVLLPEDDESVRGVLDTLAAPDSDAPHGTHERREESRVVHVVLDRLPPNYARALELKYLEDQSVEQIADELKLTLIAAQSLLARARAAFREGFEAFDLAGAQRGATPGSGT